MAKQAPKSEWAPVCFSRLWLRMHDRYSSPILLPAQFEDPAEALGRIGLAKDHMSPYSLTSVQHNSRATIIRNPPRRADEFSLQIPFERLAIDPDAIRSGLVEVFMDRVPPAALREYKETGVPPLNLKPLSWNAEQQRFDGNRVLSGKLSNWSGGRKEGFVTLSGEDYTRIFIEARLSFVKDKSGKTVCAAIDGVDLAQPVHKVVRQIVDTLPSARDMQVYWLGGTSIPPVSSSGVVAYRKAVSWKKSSHPRETRMLDCTTEWERYSVETCDFQPVAPHLSMSEQASSVAPECLVSDKTAMERNAAWGKIGKDSPVELMAFEISLREQSPLMFTGPAFAEADTVYQAKKINERIPYIPVDDQMTYWDLINDICNGLGCTPEVIDDALYIMPARTAYDGDEAYYLVDGVNIDDLKWEKDFGSNEVPAVVVACWDTWNNRLLQSRFPFDSVPSDKDKFRTLSGVNSQAELDAIAEAIFFELVRKRVSGSCVTGDMEFMAMRSGHIINLAAPSSVHGIDAKRMSQNEIARILVARAGLRERVADMMAQAIKAHSTNTYWLREGELSYDSTDGFSAALTFCAMASTEMADRKIKPEEAAPPMLLLRSARS